MAPSASGKKSPTRSERALSHLKPVSTISQKRRSFPSAFFCLRHWKKTTDRLFPWQKSAVTEKRKKIPIRAFSLDKAPCFLPDSKKARKSSNLLAFPTFPCSILVGGGGRNVNSRFDGLHKPIFVYFVPHLVQQKLRKIN